MAIISNPLHITDSGTAITLLVTDDDTVVDLSTATGLTIILRQPDGTILTRTATLTTDGRDGQMEYISTNDDFSVPGSWKVQGFIEFGSNHWHTDITKFKVDSNLQ